MEISEKKWSADVPTKWEPPEGFFKQSAEKIASGLKAAAPDLKTAMERLNFYINRAGKNLSGEDKSRLEAAKDKLSKMYEDVAPKKMSEVLNHIEESSRSEYSTNNVKKVIGDIERLLSSYKSKSDFNEEDLKRIVYDLLVKTSYISDEVALLVGMGKNAKLKKMSKEIKNLAFDVK